MSFVIHMTGIETNFTTNNLVVGKQETFNCSSDLDAQTVTWYRNGTIAASISGSYKDIVIDPVSTDHHEVVYSCVVVSPYGSQQRNTTLSVTGQKVIVTFHRTKAFNVTCMVKT